MIKKFIALALLGLVSAVGFSTSAQAETMHHHRHHRAMMHHYHHRMHHHHHTA